MPSCAAAFPSGGKMTVTCTAKSSEAFSTSPNLCSRLSGHFSFGCLRRICTDGQRLNRCSQTIGSPAVVRTSTLKRRCQTALRVTIQTAQRHQRAPLQHQLQALGRVLPVQGIVKPLPRVACPRHCQREAVHRLSNCSLLLVVQPRWCRHQHGQLLSQRPVLVPLPLAAASHNSGARRLQHLLQRRSLQVQLMRMKPLLEVVSPLLPARRVPRLARRHCDSQRIPRPWRTKA